MNAAPTSARSRIWPIARSNLPAVFSAIPVVVIPALEWLPGISPTWQPWVILGSLALATLGIVWSGVRGHRLEDVISQNDALRRAVNRTDPEYFLRQIAESLFRDGAWRISVLKKSVQSGDASDEVLVKLASASSDLDQSIRGPDILPIHQGTLFAHIFESNLADQRYRQPEESGSYPGDPLAPEWSDWRDTIFGPRPDNDSSTLRPRKFAWFAAQDPISSKVILVLAESANENGIAVDLLGHQLTPSWIFFVAHLAELRSDAR